MQFGTPVPYWVGQILDVVMLCMETHTLPGPGGVLDQDPQWMAYMLEVRRLQILVGDLKDKQRQAAERMRRGTVSKKPV
jgi:hypothetical protein